jgi:hypothetical protein
MKISGAPLFGRFLREQWRFSTERKGVKPSDFSGNEAIHQQCQEKKRSEPSAAES